MKRSKEARRVMRRIALDHWRRRVANWLMTGTFGGRGSLPDLGMTLYDLPSGELTLYQQSRNPAQLMLAVYEGGRRSAVLLTMQQAGGLSVALTDWVQLGPRRESMVPDANAKRCLHGTPEGVDCLWCDVGHPGGDPDGPQG